MLTGSFTAGIRAAMTGPTRGLVFLSQKDLWRNRGDFWSIGTVRETAGRWWSFGFGVAEIQQDYSVKNVHEIYEQIFQGGGLNHRLYNCFISNGDCFYTSLLFLVEVETEHISFLLVEKF